MTLVAPQKGQPHHKARHGRHQKHTKHFRKTYWPYLPMLMIAGLAIVISNLLPAVSAPKVLGASTDLSNTSLLAYTNSQRLGENENSLVLNNRLSKAAQAKAENMVANDYWSHNAPDGETPWSFITAAGYTYALAGENLAYGFSNASNVVTAWMNSREHRDNILNAGYSQVGFGISSTSNFQHHGPATIVVAMYAAPWSINFKVDPAASNQPQSATSQGLESRPVARVQLLTVSQNPWGIIAIALITGGGLLLILLRHARYWHKAFVRSETFVIKHPMLDVVIISFAAIGYVLGQTVGFIQ